MITEPVLAQFCGTQAHTRFNPLFPNMLLSDGARYVAEHGGQQGAFWLMDAIASHQPDVLRHEMCREIQFWHLLVNPDHTALLECRPDQGMPAVVSQAIPYTDFDLPELDLWVEPLDEARYLILLPSEH